jgi:hypothetical protein
MSHDWKKEQEFEADWWVCYNTLGEEIKQLVYAEKMGLRWFHDGKSPYNIDVEGKSIMDIGGGPVSMLLKCHNLKLGEVVDPCDYPEWIYARYEEAKINYTICKGEDILDVMEEEQWEDKVWDEVWIYNCLQHVDDLKKVVDNAKSLSKIIRIFEWIENGVSPGHPWDLTEELLNDLLGGVGKVEYVNQNGCVGKCYYGIFKGDHYAASK